ncbi:MAG: alkaline phosphatase family protein [Solirubrobacteraceae bacterium]
MLAMSAHVRRSLRRRRLPVAACASALAALALCAGCGQASPGKVSLGAASAVPPSASSHVIVVMLENTEYGEVIGNSSAPYVNSLARRYGLMTQSYAIGHPSLPNYLALTSGSTHGITSDCTDCMVSATNIVDQLERARIGWGAYLEDVPSPCFAGAQAGGYAKKHNPFAYYADIARSPSRCRRLTGFEQLADDLRNGQLPAYAWISPNLCDDGHDCGVGTADGFLARSVPALLRALGPRGFLVLEWDEGTSDRGCCGAAAGGHIATIVAGPQVRAGARSSQPIDQYGVLGSIEEAFGLSPLGGAADPRSGRLASLFVRAPRLR